LTVNGGDIILGGTGRIQGIDTVSANTDAANKTYVDNAVSGLVTGVSAGDGIVLTGTSAAPIVNIDYTGTDNAILSAVDGSGSTIASGAKIWFSDDATIAHANVSDLPFASSSHNHDSDYVNVTGDTMTGNLIIDNNNNQSFKVTGANSNYTSAAILNTGTGGAKLWLDASNGDLSGSDYASIGQNNDLNLELLVGANGGGIIFNENGGESMRIQDGNVGIGTTNPSANLDIEDASGVTIDINSSSGDGQFRFQDAGTTKWAVGRDNTQQNFVFSNSAGLSSGNVLTLEHATGNVGIGTPSPGSELEVDGEITTTTITYDEPGALDSSAYNGEIVYFGTFSSIAAGDLIVLTVDSGGLTWKQARDTTGSLATGMLGIALGTSASAGVLVRGFAKNSSWGLGWTVSDKLYLSPTAGDISNSITQDTNDYVRIIGYYLGSNKIYFCPDNTYVQNS
jgi:hypothetical protein